MDELAPVPSTAAISRDLALLMGQRQAVQRSLDSAIQACNAAVVEDENLGKLSVLFRALMDAEISEAAQMVERLQTEGLRAVFDDISLSVQAQVNVKRGKVSIDLVTTQTHLKGEVSGSALDSFGGSVATVQSVLLRVILIFRRELRPIMLLDESLPAIDGHYLLNMAAFMRKLCKQMGIECLLVTHNPALVEAADRSYQIHRRGGKARFERLK